MDNKRSLGFGFGGGPLKKVKGLGFDDDDDEAPTAAPVTKKPMSKMPILSEEVGEKFIIA